MFGMETDNEAQRVDILFREKEILRVLLLYHDKNFVRGGRDVNLLQFCKEELDGLVFENSVFESLKNEIFKVYESGSPLKIDHFLNHKDEAISHLVNELLNISHELRPSWGKHLSFKMDFNTKLRSAIQSMLFFYKFKKLNKLIVQTQLKIGEVVGNEELTHKWLNIYLNLVQARNKVASEIGFSGAVIEALNPNDQ